VSPAAPVRILTVNAGSTSLKLTVISDGRRVAEFAGLDRALTSPAPDAVVHRIVHGGHRTAAALVDDALVADLRELVELAPLHQPPALDALDRVRAALPGIPQVACFDTAFHTTMPAAASTYALPLRLRELVHAYGFHGLSHGWASTVARRVVPGARRVLVAHLGGGASLCAVLEGVSVDTTMGFTPLDGLVMATRSGSVDPGAVLWLAAHTDEDLGSVFERESGLLGLCGSGDLRTVLHRVAAGDADASLAFEVYLHRLARDAAGMVAALGGLDVLVLTGGVGENSADVRTALADRLSWLGVAITEPTADGSGTEAGAESVEITAPGAAVRTLVVPAREDLRMATEAITILTRVEPYESVGSVPLSG
jgi:acetate kinase